MTVRVSREGRRGYGGWGGVETSHSSGCGGLRRRSSLLTLSCLLGLVSCGGGIGSPTNLPAGGAALLPGFLVLLLALNAAWLAVLTFLALDEMGGEW